MFWKTLKMELARAFYPTRLLLVICFIVALLIIGGDWEVYQIMFQQDYGTMGSIDKLFSIFCMDTFKCLIVVLLAGIYTGSFCKDNNTRYLRMILARVDVTTYTQCRFLANLCAIVFASICSLYLYVFAMLPWMPLVPDRGVVQGYYYLEIVQNWPLIYVAMMGIVFGLVAAACSSIGMLYSVYKSNTFVSVAVSGILFYAAISYIPAGSVFNVITMVGMGNTLGVNAPKPLMFLWSIVYMTSLIGIVGVLFWRKMKWRVENGYI